MTNERKHELLGDADVARCAINNCCYDLNRSHGTSRCAKDIGKNTDKLMAIIEELAEAVVCKSY